MAMGLSKGRKEIKSPDSLKSECLQTCAARPTLRDSFQGSCSLSALFVTGENSSESAFNNLVSSLSSKGNHK
jgi:hypothetical protein